MKDTPTIGATYNCFDDGKIRPSRCYTAKITEVIPFKDIDQETLDLWKKEVETCHWLYAEETDVFVKADCGDEEQVFVRTKDGGWFSMGFLMAGRLDIDGSLMEYMNQQDWAQ